MIIEINIIDGATLQEQSQVFQAWFNENIQTKIDFADSCSIYDTCGRPSEWHFSECKVTAKYFTSDENYSFDKFIINKL